MLTNYLAKKSSQNQKQLNELAKNVASTKINSINYVAKNGPLKKKHIK